MFIIDDIEVRKNLIDEIVDKQFIGNKELQLNKKDNTLCFEKQEIRIISTALHSQEALSKSKEYKEKIKKIREIIHKYYKNIEGDKE